MSWAAAALQSSLPCSRTRCGPLTLQRHRHCLITALPWRGLYPCGLHSPLPALWDPVLCWLCPWFLPASLEEGQRLPYLGHNLMRPQKSVY